LKYFEAELCWQSEQRVHLKGGMGKKQRRSTAEAIAACRVRAKIILATGSYIGEGFDDARLIALSAMPISWKGRYSIRRAFHRLHDASELCESTITWIPTSSCWANVRASSERYNLIGYTIRDASNGTSFFQRVEKSISQRGL